ncbi:hypothetical protein chiPu_0018939 [Chiloscyllium punctatum]|uniref:Uncharacterized protein n=1 Tax=Chiloscyllium punctatum TaxID=137246 RepID=A0A401RRB7_CHIPU|nr:hypothetical protein [Chiloscyllium punctatum]
MMAAPVALTLTPSLVHEMILRTRQEPFSQRTQQFHLQSPSANFTLQAKEKRNKEQTATEASGAVSVRGSGRPSPRVCVCELQFGKSDFGEHREKRVVPANKTASLFA